MGSLLASVRYTPMTILLCLDSWSVLTGIYGNQGVLCMWSCLVGFIWRGMPLPDAAGRAVSCIVLVLWGQMVGHPMRFLHLVCVLELCYPTFDSWPESGSGTFYTTLLGRIRSAVDQMRSLVKQFMVAFSIPTSYESGNTRTKYK